MVVCQKCGAYYYYEHQLRDVHKCPAKQSPVDVADARAALNRFCQGKERMCVPANPNDDDMVLSAALDELEQARSEIVRLRGALSGAATAANVAGSEIQRLRERIAELSEVSADGGV